MDKRLSKELRTIFKTRFLNEFPGFEMAKDGIFPKNIYAGSDAYGFAFGKRNGYIIVSPHYKPSYDYFILVAWNKPDTNFGYVKPKDEYAIVDCIESNSLTIPEEIKTGRIDLSRLKKCNFNWITIPLNSADIEDKEKRSKAINASLDETFASIEKYAIPFLNK